MVLCRASVLGGSDLKIVHMDAFENIETEMLTALAVLKRETDLVYRNLVLPNWGSPDFHGFPSILYGTIMSAMSLSDRLSCYLVGEAGGDQTKRMRALFETRGHSAESAKVAVQLWRHTLMHTGMPSIVIDHKTGISYHWLLHWGSDHLPKVQHMTFQQLGPNERVLNFGASFLVDDLYLQAIDLFELRRKSAGERQRICDVHTRIAARQRF